MLKEDYSKNDEKLVNKNKMTLEEKLKLMGSPKSFT